MLKKAISTYLFCVVVLVIWIAANTLAIRSNYGHIQSNTIDISKNAQNIELLATLQQQSVETNQLLIETLERMETAIYEQGRLIERSVEQTRQFIEKMEATNE